MLISSGYGQLGSRFDTAVDIVLKHEGGYVWNPKDPGGETKYGISKRSYPNVDIKNLTIPQAKDIYYKDFWVKCGFDKIESDRIAFRLFDLGVNVGCGGIAKIARRGLRRVGYNVSETGSLSVEIIKVINSHPDQIGLYDAMVSEGEKYYKSLSKPQFEKSWLARLYSKEIEIAGFKTTSGVVGIAGLLALVVIGLSGYYGYRYYKSSQKE